MYRIKSLMSQFPMNRGLIMWLQSKVEVWEQHWVSVLWRRHARSFINPSSHACALERGGQSCTLRLRWAEQHEGRDPRFYFALWSKFEATLGFREVYVAVERQEAETPASKPRNFLGSQRPCGAGFCRVVPARNRGRLDNMGYFWV